MICLFTWIFTYLPKVQRKLFSSLTNLLYFVNINKFRVCNTHNFINFIFLGQKKNKVKFMTIIIVIFTAQSSHKHVMRDLSIRLKKIIFPKERRQTIQVFHIIQNIILWKDPETKRTSQCVKAIARSLLNVCDLWALTRHCMTKPWCHYDGYNKIHLASSGHLTWIFSLTYFCLFFLTVMEGCLSFQQIK